MQDSPKPLPIVWYLSAEDLPMGENKANCYKKISEAVAAWEADGERTLNDLRQEIDAILKQHC